MFILDPLDIRSICKLYLDKLGHLKVTHIEIGRNLGNGGSWSKNKLILATFIFLNPMAPLRSKCSAIGIWLKR